MLHLTEEVIAVNPANYSAWWGNSCISAFNFPRVRKCYPENVTPRFFLPKMFNPLLTAQACSSWSHGAPGFLGEWGAGVHWAAAWEQSQELSDLVGVWPSYEALAQYPLLPLRHHRRLMAKKIGSGSEEFRVTAEILKEDSKNYHAWGHRQWAVKEFGTWQSELAFVATMLKEDLRNNSAWTQRYVDMRYS